MLFQPHKTGTGEWLLLPDCIVIRLHLHCNRAILVHQSGKTYDVIGEYLRCNRAILAMRLGNTCDAIGQYL